MVAGGEPYGKLGCRSSRWPKDGRIAWIGPAAEAGTGGRAGHPVEECRGLWITPGLIDCHTHLVYGGDRVEEFEKRLCGASYEEIARAGGGIQSTVNATRAADAAELARVGHDSGERLMAEGVTTIEVKSGYGLDFGGRAAHARGRALARARDLPVSIKTTYLGLHALPRGI